MLAGISTLISFDGSYLCLNKSLSEVEIELKISSFIVIPSHFDTLLSLSEGIDLDEVKLAIPERSPFSLFEVKQLLCCFDNKD